MASLLTLDREATSIAPFCRPNERILYRALEAASHHTRMFNLSGALDFQPLLFRAQEELDRLCSHWNLGRDSWQKVQELKVALSL